MKCPSNPSDYPYHGGAYYDRDNPMSGYPGTAPWDVCVVTDGSQVSPSAPACDPTVGDPLGEWSGVEPPSHEGTFTTTGSPNNSADVTVNGVTVAVDYDGDYTFALYDCVPARNQTICDMELKTMNLTLLGNPVFGDYEVDGATLDLAAPESTKATFNCNSSSCFGTFEFSKKIKNPISLNLSWDQTTTSTGTIGGGSILLSNGRNGYGGVKKMTGQLDLDASMISGTLRLIGQGSDSFGGDFASATFDVTGPVGRYTP